MNRGLEVYSTSLGLVHCSVCVPKGWDIATVTNETNDHNPTGLDHGWRVADDKFFADGVHTNPCPCGDDREGRLHYLMVC